MKHWKRPLSALLALSLALTLYACSGQPVSDTSGSQSTSSVVSDNSDGYYPVTITNYNYAGEEVSYTYNQAPQRVLAVYQGCIETMIALGLEDHVIASYGLDNEVKPEWQDGFSKMH